MKMSRTLSPAQIGMPAETRQALVQIYHFAQLPGTGYQPDRACPPLKVAVEILVAVKA
jgi:hypothetical protein